MPERVTKEERIVSLAIEKARKAKEELSAKKRMNIEPTQVQEVDTSVEEVKIKRPKVQDASKITNQTRKDEGYGLAGESLKKAERTIEQDSEAYSRNFRNFKSEFKELVGDLRRLEEGDENSRFTGRGFKGVEKSIEDFQRAFEVMKIDVERKQHNLLRIRHGKENVPPYKKK